MGEGDVPAAGKVGEGLIAEAAGEIVIDDDGDGFEGVEEAAVVEVVAADDRPHVIDDGGLGVEDGAGPFEEADAGAQKLMVEFSAGIGAGRDVAVLAQGHGDENTALGSTGQGQADTAVGDEVGVFDEDVAAGAFDGVKIGAMDAAAVAEFLVADKMDGDIVR